MRNETDDVRPDGFRPRRLRPAGWLERAIAEGVVRDPHAPPEERSLAPAPTGRAARAVPLPAVCHPVRGPHFHPGGARNR